MYLNLSAFSDNLVNPGGATSSRTSICTVVNNLSPTKGDQSQISSADKSQVTVFNSLSSAKRDASPFKPASDSKYTPSDVSRADVSPEKTPARRGVSLRCSTASDIAEFLAK